VYIPNYSLRRIQLIDAAPGARNEIERRVLYYLSMTMYRRVEAVKAAESWYTKY
jgi:hypothetical protein